MSSCPTSPFRFLRIGSLLCLTVMLCACAERKPMEAIGHAEGSVNRIQTPEVQRHASSEVTFAAMELTEAQRDLSEGDHDNVLRFSERAQLDAQLAEAKASRVQAEKRLSVVNKELEHLQDVTAKPAR